MILISSNYRITVSVPVYGWHPLIAPTLRKKKANPVMTRSVRHRHVFVVLVVRLRKTGLELSQKCGDEGRGEAVCDF